MRKTIRIASLLCLALLLMALPLISACGDDGEEEAVEKKKEVVVGVLSDFSGPSAAIMAPFWGTVVTGIQYVNEVEGGIDGAEIILDWVDTQWQVSKSLAGFKRIVAQKPKPVMFITQTGQETGVLLDLAEEEQVPLLAFTIFEDALSPPGWAFAMMAPQADQFAALVDYIMENWTEARAPRMAHIGPDDAWGRSAFLAFPYAEDKGMEIKTEFMSQAAIDTTAQLIRIRSWEADFVFIQAIETQAIMVLKDAERLGGLLDQIQFILPPHAHPYTVMDIVGEAADGVWSISIGYRGPEMLRFPGGEMEKAQVEHVKGDYDYRSKADTGGYAYSGLIVATLRGAAAEVGIDNLDGLAVYNVLDRGFEWGPGGIQIPFRFGPDKRVGTSSFLLYEMRGGELYPLTDLIDPPHILEP